MLNQCDFKMKIHESGNEKLQHEVEDLKCENACLKRSLQEAEKKISEYKPNFELPSPLRSLGRSSDLAASKIVELSKQVRELKTKLGSAQSKANTAEAQLNVYMAGTKAAEELTKDKFKEVDSTDIEIKEKEIKDLKRDLTNSINKLCYSRNQIQQLKYEIKLYEKILISEVGDEDVLQSALSGSGNWKGRAEQIIALRKKVSELLSTEIPQKEKSELSRAADERQVDKEKIEWLTKELEMVREELNDTLNKFEAAHTQIKELTNELGECRMNLQSANARHVQDERIISKLTTQLAESVEGLKEQEESLTQTLKDKINTLAIELKQERLKAEQLNDIISEQELKVSRLESRISESRLSESRMCKSRLSDIYSPCPMMEQNENRQISAAIGFYQPSPTNSVNNCPQTSEAERMRIMELIAVLNKRIEAERKLSEKAQDDLRKERHRGAKLETKLARLEMENIGCSRQSGISSSYKSALQKIAHPSITGTEYENIKDKCELLHEKCLALKTRIETLRQERDEERRVYLNIIEETRQTLRDHIKAKSC